MYYYYYYYYYYYCFIDILTYIILESTNYTIVTIKATTKMKIKTDNNNIKKTTIPITSKTSQKTIIKLKKNSDKNIIKPTITTTTTTTVYYNQRFQT